jgi:hypothetical protein
VYGQTMARAPSFYMHQIQRQMFRDVVAVLRKVDANLAPSSMAETELGRVKEFGVVVQLAQRQGVPLSKVTGADEDQRDAAWLAFQKIAQNIVKRTHATVRKGATISTKT